MQNGCFLPQITKLSSPARELESRAFLTPELKLLTLSLDACHKIPNLRDGIEKNPPGFWVLKLRHLKESLPHSTGKGHKDPPNKTAIVHKAPVESFTSSSNYNLKRNTKR